MPIFTVREAMIIILIKTLGTHTGPSPLLWTPAARLDFPSPWASCGSLCLAVRLSISSKLWNLSSQFFNSRPYCQVSPREACGDGPARPETGSSSGCFPSDIGCVSRPVFLDYFIWLFIILLTFSKSRFLLSSTFCFLLFPPFYFFSFLYLILRVDAKGIRVQFLFS